MKHVKNSGKKLYNYVFVPLIIVTIYSLINLFTFQSLHAQNATSRVREKLKSFVVKEIPLSPVQLKAFEGKYKLNGGDEDDILEITSHANNLILKQLWDGQEITFVPQSPLDFYCKEKLFPLKFSKDNNGTVTQVLAFNQDVWIKAKK